MRSGRLTKLTKSTSTHGRCPRALLLLDWEGWMAFTSVARSTGEFDLGRESRTEASVNLSADCTDCTFRERDLP
jgi:hypothetical protein